MYECTFVVLFFSDWIGFFACEDCVCFLLVVCIWHCLIHFLAKAYDTNVLESLSAVCSAAAACSSLICCLSPRVSGWRTVSAIIAAVVFVVAVVAL